MHIHSKNNKYLGFSLIELVIANFILVVGFLGLTGMVLNSLQRLENNYWHVLAGSVLISLAEVARISHRDFLGLEMACKELLPEGKCKVESQAIRVCWHRNSIDQCLELPKQYEV